jgi:hypothetical protein
MGTQDLDQKIQAKTETNDGVDSVCQGAGQKNNRIEQIRRLGNGRREIELEKEQRHVFILNLALGVFFTDASQGDDAVGFDFGFLFPRNND